MTWPLSTGAKIVAGAILLAVIAIILALSTCSDRSASTSVTKATQRNDVAKDKAAEERRSDDAQILSNQQERTDAINAAPKGETGPATRALNCARWVRTHGGKAHPACVRPGS